MNITNEFYIDENEILNPELYKNIQDDTYRYERRDGKYKTKDGKISIDPTIIDEFRVIETNNELWLYEKKEFHILLKKITTTEIFEKFTIIFPERDKYIYIKDNKGNLIILLYKQNNAGYGDSKRLYLCGRKIEKI